MAKNFAPRLSKKQRKKVDLSEKIDRDVFKLSDDRLLQGAKLLEIKLSDIKVKEQVRTKFNDASIRELAANIQANGLIQPLVVHRDGEHHYRLICGERRFRAMSSIEMRHAPCFVLENKTEEELMAIQFSENSAREALHYVDKADGILNYQRATKASERKIQSDLGISKSEVHRSLMIARMPQKIKEAAKAFNIEKYVLIEWDALGPGEDKKELEANILSGHLRKRGQLAQFIKSRSLTSRSVAKKTKKKTTRTRKTAPKTKQIDQDLVGLLAKSVAGLDARTQKKLQKILSESSSGLID